MNINSVVSTFTNVLSTAVELEWDEHEMGRLILCLLKSTNRTTGGLNSKNIHKILHDSKTLKAPIVTALVQENIVSSQVTLGWILQLDFNNMITLLQKCFEEDTYTVLAKYSNSVLDTLVNYLHHKGLLWSNQQKMRFMLLVSTHHQIDKTTNYCKVLNSLMQNYISDVLPLLKQSKEFIKDLTGSKLPLKKLCVDQLKVPEDDYNRILKLKKNGDVVESDADSDDNLRDFISNQDNVSLDSPLTSENNCESGLNYDVNGHNKKRTKLMSERESPKSSNSDEENDDCSECSSNSNSCFTMVTSVKRRK